MLTTATVCTSLSQLGVYPVVDLLVLAVVFHGDVRLAASPLDNAAQGGSAFATNCRPAGSTLCLRCEAAAVDVSSAGSCRGALDSRRRQRGHRRFPSDCAAVALAHEIASFCHAVLAQKQSLRMAPICKLLKCQKSLSSAPLSNATGRGNVLVAIGDGYPLDICKRWHWRLDQRTSVTGAPSVT